MGKTCDAMVGQLGRKVFDAGQRIDVRALAVEQFRECALGHRKQSEKIR
jgi:hypothetical protein